MEETIYGIQVVRRPLPSLVKALDEQGGVQTIQFWKSWPDGAACRMVELRPDEVPTHRPMQIHLTPWKKLDLHRGGHYTFDLRRDWWIGPVDIEAIVLWVGSPVDPRFMTITTRRGTISSWKGPNIDDGRFGES